MLKLEKMEISGFKSFSDRTSIQFREGITAVVGPNGCGKSNIGDAINWVLGEQSPKMLRGKHMADVIFNGSDSRKPTGIAEVTLCLSGTNGSSATHVEGDEPQNGDAGAQRAHEGNGNGKPAAHAGNGANGNQISITRRLFRNGESDYLMNGARTRLKDIQEMLRRERVGAKTYATIEQGRIDQIINAKPKEIRLIIEEAAGVSGFKHKRRLTELKLEGTQANLLRVNDIVVEVKRQINSLRRQAAKARRYQRLRDEFRAKQKSRYAARAAAMDADLRRFRDAEAQAKSAEAEAAARLAEFEAQLASERAAIDESGRGFREASESLHQRDIDVDRGEAQVGLCRERIAEADELARRLDAEADELAERRGALEQRFREHQASLGTVDLRLGESTERLTAKLSEFGAADEQVRTARAELEQLRGGLFEAMNRLAQERNRRATLEDGIARCRRQIERLQQELDGARGDFTRFGAQADELAGELQRHRGEVERLEQRCATLERDLGGARESHSALLGELGSAREAEKSAASRLRTLEDVSTRFAGVSDGVRALLTQGHTEGIRSRGVVADFVEAGQDVEAAAEVYLQGILPAVILEDDDDARRASELLRRERAGRTAFICRSQPVGSPSVGTSTSGRSTVEFPAELLGDRRVLGRLRDSLSLDTAQNGALQERIGDAVLVDTLESALELHRRHPRIDFLTRQGEVVYASGVVIAGGEGHADRGLLAHTRQTQQTQSDLLQAAARSADLLGRVTSAHGEIDRVDAELGAAREGLDSARRRLVELELGTQRSSEDRERTERRSGVLADELEDLEREAQSLEQQRTACLTGVGEAERVHEEGERQLSARSTLLEQLESSLRVVAEEAAALRAGVAAEQERAESARSESRRLSEAVGDLASRIEAKRTEAEAARSRARETAELLRRTEADLAGHVEDRERRGKEVAGLEQSIADRRRELEQNEKSLVTQRTEFETLREAAREEELARSQAESERRHLDELCREELGIDATQAASEAEAAEAEGAEAGAAPEAIDLEALEQRIAEIRAKLEQMGPVNILAIEEFSDLEERYAFLTGQQDDLQKSMESLRETIRRINRSTRERFTEAFESIRGYYQETFKSLFRGGRGDLRLEESEDVLEAGIEILAQPPGKRLGSVQLMSGGERAMSAIALLFAIFRYQPSPFCLLDEVDAPLDDANVTRFTRLLQDFAGQTQFILITHNKLSMEVADLLYGVTMQEAGVSKVVSLQLQ